MIIFSYVDMHGHSGVTVSMFAFQAGGQGSNPHRDKFFHENMENIFIKLFHAIAVLCLFSALTSYMSTVV